MKKLRLQSETLRALESEDLAAVDGAGIRVTWSTFCCTWYCDPAPSAHPPCPV
jgi:hypothetical protein